MNRSRAALLPMPGDPIILAHFISNFNAIWSDEVDKLYILLNIDHRMPDWIVELDQIIAGNNPKIEVLTVREMLFQGAALRYMLPFVKEELIMSIEDDTVIVKKGQIDKCFRKIEMGEADVLGSPRSVCSPEILEACKVKWNLDYSGYGDRGPTYWPNFFFCKKADLLKTDLHFEPKGWEAGDYIKEIDLEVKSTLSSDVFTWLCIQLRAMGLRFYDIPQYHSHPDDMVDMAMGLNLADPNCPWVHIGSLTMTAEDLLMQIGDPKTHRNKPESDMAKKEMERRYAWLILFMEKIEEQIPVNLRDSYTKRINEFISAFNLSVQNIYNLIKVYRRFITW